MLAGARWPMAAPLRYLSYTIDTVLLTAALMLATPPPVSVRARLADHQGAAAGGVHRARQFCAEARRHAAVARLGFVAALLVYLFIVSVARAHDPLGIFALLGL